MPNGDWLVCFLTGGVGEPEAANFIGMCRSTDQGQTWGELEIVLCFEDRACLFSEFFVHDDLVTMFVQSHGGNFNEWRVWTITSADNGHTWSMPEPFTPMSRRSFLWNRVVTSWGDWIVPFQTYDTVDDPSGSPHDDGSFARPLNGILISNDEGGRWAQSNRIGPTKNWAENNVVELPDGTLAMLIRTDGSGRLHRSNSGNRGQFWSEPVPTDIPNPGSRFRLFRLANGEIALLHNPNHETSHPNSKRQAQCNRNPLALWISDDSMRSWGYKRVLIDFPGMLAYPDGVLDEESGYLHFSFDYNRHDVVYYGARLP